MTPSEQELEKFRNCKHLNVQSYTDYCLDCGHNTNFGGHDLVKKIAQELRDSIPKQEWFTEFNVNPGW